MWVGTEDLYLRYLSSTPYLWFGVQLLCALPSSKFRSTVVARQGVTTKGNSVFVAY